MSRELKFRAYDTDQKYMIQDSPISMSGIVKNRIRHAKDANGHGIGEHYVIMQFTGRKDKNGVNEIYEDDIMFRQIKNGKGKVIREYKAAVVYVPELAGYYLAHDGSGTMLGSTYEELSDWAVFGEVIGNIFDNPELLVQK